MNASPAEIQKALGGVDYPATRSDLIAHAEDSGASEDVIHDLEQLEDEEFDGPAAVMAELGEDEELDDLGQDDGFGDDE